MFINGQMKHVGQLIDKWILVGLGGGYLTPIYISSVYLKNKCVSIVQAL